MISNEPAQKKSISPKVASVYPLCAAGHPIQSTSFHILGSTAPSDRWDS